MQLVFATNNSHKVTEVSDLLEGFGFEVINLSSFPQIGDIAETGETFAENAALKCEAVRVHAPESVIIADDSGLCVDALNGAPGIYSARYAGEDASQDQMCQKLLTELSGETNRKAYFISVYAISFPDDPLIYAEGRIDGEITTEMSGANGFGYDPVFAYKDGGGQTLAEIDLQQKNKISHRARALTEVKSILATKTSL